MSIYYVPAMALSILQGLFHLILTTDMQAHSSSCPFLTGIQEEEVKYVNLASK